MTHKFLWKKATDSIPSGLIMHAHTIVPISSVCGCRKATRKGRRYVAHPGARRREGGSETPSPWFLFEQLYGRGYMFTCLSAAVSLLRINPRRPFLLD